MALLSVKSASKTYLVAHGPLRRSVGQVHALRDVSLEVNAGETVAVVGGSGCGKSTLAKAIAGLNPLDAGQILWDGLPIDRLPSLDRARRLQLIFQDPFASLNPKLTVGRQLREMIALRERQQGPDAAGLLADVGLGADVLDNYPFQFSGGQRQRIAIARALAMLPRLLIADEPLSALDVTVAASVLQLLTQLRSQYGLAILFITHDLAVAEEFAQRIVVMQEGRIVEEGPSRDVLQSPRHPYTQALLAAVPRV